MLILPCLWSEWIESDYFREEMRWGGWSPPLGQRPFSDPTLSFLTSVEPLSPWTFLTSVEPLSPWTFPVEPLSPWTFPVSRLRPSAELIVSLILTRWNCYPSGWNILPTSLLVAASNRPLSISVTQPQKKLPFWRATRPRTAQARRREKPLEIEMAPT